jgi:hypothetical protein
VTAAELRARAIKLLAPQWDNPTEVDIARADVWARLAISAAIEETGQAARRVDTQ